MSDDSYTFCELPRVNPNNKVASPCVTIHALTRVMLIYMQALACIHVFMHVCMRALGGFECIQGSKAMAFCFHTEGSGS